MSKHELFRRYAMFLLSVVIIAFGLCGIVKSDLGTSPISSAPYVFSVNTPVTIGTYLFILCLMFILVQMAILGKKGMREKRVELLAQIPISFIFGVFTDIAMWILSDLNPDTYLSKMITLVVGCFVLALGICFEVSADVMMMGGEYTVQVAAQRFKKEFGTVKIFFDITLVMLAIISSLCFVLKVEGIREGTIITALITGPFVKFIMPRLAFVRSWQLYGARRFKSC